MSTFDEISGNVLLIDPTSPEVNRGSFCYLSYLVYSHLNCTMAVSHVSLLEEFRVSDFDKHNFDPYDHICIALWSYPQIDTCLMLHRFFKGKARFYGYYPLIEHLGLPSIAVSQSVISNGLRCYPIMLCENAFKYVLLSDCDKHIKDSSKRAVSNIDQQMIPMFTSYGCPIGCSFCAATVNCDRKRTILSVEAVVEILYSLKAFKKLAIHFTDEDFFFNAKRAAKILLAAYHCSPDFEFIALGELQSVRVFCAHVEADYSKEDQDRIWHCLRLIEIGFETADTNLAEAMGKLHISNERMPTLVQEKCRCPVLWLTVTFFPGETIATLNATGAFLKQYGFNPADMEERIVTNGTEGGLGQFFQYYHGTGMSYAEYKFEGLVLTERPMRLIPSFIPYSFLQSRFTIDYGLWEERWKDVLYWLSVYGIDQVPSLLQEAMVHVGEDLDMPENTPFRVSHMIAENFFEKHTEGLVPYTVVCNSCIAIAIMARLGILKGV